MILEGNSIEECVKNLNFVKGYKPYKYGGKWFIGMVEGVGYAYRNKKSLLNKAAKSGMTTINLVEYGNG